MRRLYPILWVVTLAFVACSDSTNMPTPLPAPPPPRATPSPTPDATADYVVRFEATWSAPTHPNDFPPNPHFSGLIAGTHRADVRFWEPGETASDGIKEMAEKGSKSPLDAIVTAAIEAGQAEFLLSGDGISRSPDAIELGFSVTTDFPVVTVVSMVAPSPDWFVGVSALELIQNGDWSTSSWWSSSPTMPGRTAVRHTIPGTGQPSRECRSRGSRERHCP